MPKTKDEKDKVKKISTSKKEEKVTKDSSKKEEKAKAKTKAKTKEESKKASKKTTKKKDTLNEFFTAKNILVDKIEIKTKPKKKAKESSEKQEKAKVKLYKSLDQLLDRTLNTVEYYDLPYSYNITEIRTVAQTPKTLFIYWDVNDEMINNLKKYYGDDFLETTKPVLQIYNDTLNYSFEIEINDFTNSWYLHINNPNSKYRVELARKPKDAYYFNNVNKQRYESQNKGKEYVSTDYIYLSTSNAITAPSDHILFETFNPHILFRNVKTGQEYYQDMSYIGINNMEKLYNIYDLYKMLYNQDDLSCVFNPSSMVSSNVSSSSFIYKE